MGKSEVSRVCQALDEHVEAFRGRPLEGRCPYLFLDAEVEKVRDGGRVVAKALVIAHGVHETGRREILGLDVGEAETEAFWTDFLRDLVKRGLVGVRQAVSDAHAGLLRSTGPLERSTRRSGGAPDIVGILPDDRSLIRLAGMLCIEQSDEWLVGRGCLSAESTSLVLARPDDHTGNTIKEAVPSLQAA